MALKRDPERLCRKKQKPQIPQTTSQTAANTVPRLRSSLRWGSARAASSQRTDLSEMGISIQPENEYPQKQHHHRSIMVKGFGLLTWPFDQLKEMKDPQKVRRSKDEPLMVDLTIKFRAWAFSQEQTGYWRLLHFWGLLLPALDVSTGISTTQLAQVKSGTRVFWMCSCWFLGFGAATSPRGPGGGRGPSEIPAALLYPSHLIDSASPLCIPRLRRMMEGAAPVQAPQFGSMPPDMFSRSSSREFRIRVPAFFCSLF